MPEHFRPVLFKCIHARFLKYKIHYGAIIDHGVGSDMKNKNVPKLVAI